MKALIILSLFLTSTNIYSNTESKKTIQIPTDKKVEYKPIIKAKYSLSLSNNVDLKYSLVMPMKKENLGMLQVGTKKNRFDTRHTLQNRFQNLKNIDLVSILEKNKQNNSLKTIQIRNF